MAETAIKVRPARSADVSALCAFLNEIIRIGGTTAHERPFTHESFRGHFLAGENEVLIDILVKLRQTFTFNFQNLKSCLLKVKIRLYICM